MVKLQFLYDKIAIFLKPTKVQIGGGDMLPIMWLFLEFFGYKIPRFWICQMLKLHFVKQRFLF